MRLKKSSPVEEDSYVESKITLCHSGIIALSLIGNHVDPSGCFVVHVIYRRLSCIFIIHSDHLYGGSGILDFESQQSQRYSC